MATESIKYTAPNPFPSVNTTPTKVDQGMVNTAMSGVQNANTAGNVSQVDGTKYNNQQASTYEASQGQATNWNVDDNQTVSGQINRVIAQDSPLMQQAATSARQQAAKRGLVNSTMAVQAGQAALYEKAMPIAQADAGTYANAAKSNQDAANSFSQFNATAQNQAGQFNAGAKNQLQSQTIDIGAKADQTNAAATNDARARDATINSQQSLAKLDSVLKVATQNASAAEKMQLTQMDANIRTQLANVEATYKTQMQTSQSMAASYQSMIDNVTRIMMDSNLNATAKQAAINKQTTLYNNALQMQEQMSGLELGQLLSPESFSTGATTTNPTSGTSDATWRGVVDSTVGQQ